MRRIKLVLAVAALVVAMLVATAAPALANVNHNFGGDNFRGFENGSCFGGCNSCFGGCASGVFFPSFNFGGTSFLDGNGCGSNFGFLDGNGCNNNFGFFEGED